MGATSGFTGTIPPPCRQGALEGASCYGYDNGEVVLPLFFGGVSELTWLSGSWPQLWEGIEASIRSYNGLVTYAFWAF
jgi:hypothetical protein